MNSKRQGVLSIFLSRGLYFGVGISLSYKDIANAIKNQNMILLNNMHKE